MSREKTVQTESPETGNSGNATEDVVKITARPAQAEAKQQGALQLHEPVSLSGNRPIMPNTFEIVEMFSEAGLRPIGASSLHLAGSFLNGRPVESSSLKVQETLPGNRPIFSNDFHMIEGALLNRPIMASDPLLMQGSFLPGNRPIAPNDVDDGDTIMGFLD